MKSITPAFLLTMLLFSFSTLSASPQNRTGGDDDHSSHQKMDQQSATGHDAHEHGLHGGENEWESPIEEVNRPNPVSASKESIATGSRLFKHFCITCHGYKADGKGLSGQKLNPKPANLTKMAGHHTDGDLAYKIKTGRGPMPHWEMNISDTNVWHIVNFIQNLKPLGKEGNSSSKNPHDHSKHKH